MKSVAIIPAHNEARSLHLVIHSTLRFVDEVIVVDDGSRDGTSEAAKESGAHVVRHAINLGKGAALKTGCDRAIERGATHLIALDADGQHQPKDIPAFLEKLKDHDIVLGFRTLSGAMPFVYRLGNRIIELASSILFGLHVRDTQCGFRAFTASAYRKLRWKSPDYSVESEMIARIGKRRLRFAQIPIATIYADKYKGTTIVDGVKIVLNMVRWRLLRSI